MLCDIKMQSFSFPLNSREQGHLVTFVKSHIGGIF